MAALLNLQVTVITAASWLLVLQEPAILMTTNKPYSAATSPASSLAEKTHHQVSQWCSEVCSWRVCPLNPPGEHSSLVGLLASLNTACLSLSAFSFFCHLPEQLRYFSFTSACSVQFSSVAQSCLTLCDPMNCSTPALPVHHQLPEFTQTHVHRVGNAIQPSHPLSSPSPPAPNPSQHLSLFQWVNSSHEVAKVLEFQL